MICIVLKCFNWEWSTNWHVFHSFFYVFDVEHMGKNKEMISQSKKDENQNVFGYYCSRSCEWSPFDFLLQDVCDVEHKKKEREEEKTCSCSEFFPNIYYTLNSSKNYPKIIFSSFFVCSKYRTCRERNILLNSKCLLF